MPSETKEQLAGLLVKLKLAPDVSQGPLLLKVLWTLLGFSIVVVLLRIWTKFTRARRLYYDDYLMVAALLVGIVHAVIVTLAISNGLGRHMIHLTLPQLEGTMKYGSLSLLSGWLSPMLGRIAFCCTIFYLTKTDSRIPIWPIWVFIVLQVFVNFLGIVLFYIQCGTNLDTFWNLKKSLNFEEYCWDAKIQTDYQYFMGSINILTDCFLAVLPAILIEHTKLSRKSKTALWFLLCLSTLAMVASVVKTYESRVLSEITDYTFNLSAYVIWISVELNVVIITASIPLLRPLFKRPRISASRPPSSTHLQTAPPSWRSHIQLGSGLSSKNRSRDKVHEHSTQSASISSLWDEEGGGIVVTREVQVSYETMEAPFLHAALVGLVQGEMANPRLVRRYDEMC